jgi:hypothetical protein
VFVVEEDEDLVRCSRCRELKPRSAFTLRGSSGGRPDTYCRPCRSEYGKEHYAANRALYIEKARARKRDQLRTRVEFLIEYFASHPCADCGEGDPVVLEFDHLSDKEFNVSYGINNMSWCSVLAEMEKCEVVCANCHRRRTAQRRGSLRAILTEGEKRDEERATRIELVPRPWKGLVQPLHHARDARPSVERKGPRTDKGPGEPGPPPCL